MSDGSPSPSQCSTEQDVRRDNRYGNGHAGPYVVFFERTGADGANDKHYFQFARAFFGKLNKFAEHRLACPVKKAGFSRFKATFTNFSYANEMIEAFNRLDEFIGGESWMAYIPTHRLFKDFSIRGIDDPSVTEEEVRSFLRSPPGWDQAFPEIVKVERIKRVKKEFVDGKLKPCFVVVDGKKIPQLENTNLFKVRLKTNGVPDRASMWGVLVNLHPFIDKPRRCAHCQRFGHIARFCKNKNRDAVCGNCGAFGHIADDCKDTNPCCINCKRNKLDDTNHPAFDNNCPTYLFQREVKAVMASHSVDQHLAIKMLNEHNGKNPPKKRTYAEAVQIDYKNLITIVNAEKAAKKSKLEEQRKTRAEIKKKKAEHFQERERIWLKKKEEAEKRTVEAQKAREKILEERKLKEKVQTAEPEFKTAESMVFSTANIKRKSNDDDEETEQLNGGKKVAISFESQEDKSGNFSQGARGFYN